MKKISKFSITLTLCAAFALTSFYSCSSDSLQNESEAKFSSESELTLKSLSSSDFEKAKQMYKAMTLTPEWTSYATARNEFAANMRGSKVFFTKKSDYMTWIQSNLQYTGFSSVGHFEASFDNMTGTYDVLIVKNPLLFSYIDKADTHQLYPIMESGLDPLPTVESSSLPCVIDCTLTLASDLGEAVNNYNLNMQAVNTYSNSNLAGAVETRFISEATDAISNFAGCMEGC